MSKTKTWLDAVEVAQILDIRPSRVAQLMRARLLAFVTAVGGPLFHSREIAQFRRDYPELLASLQVENEGDKMLGAGELPFWPDSYPPEITPNSVVCVKRKQGSFLSRLAKSGQLDLPRL